jgi:hypothetical protein
VIRSSGKAVQRRPIGVDADNLAKNMHAKTAASEQRVTPKPAEAAAVDGDKRTAAQRAARWQKAHDVWVLPMKCRAFTARLKGDAL